MTRIALISMRFITSWILFVALSVTVGAQSLSLKHAGIAVSNDSVYLSGYPEDNLVSVKLAVTNQSELTLDVKVRKTVITNVTGSTNTYCWAGVCFIPSVSDSPVSVSIAPGRTDSTSFVGDYQSNGNAGTAAIRYTFYNVANPSDQVSVTVFYNISSSSTDPNRITKPWFRAYPNPADRQMSVLVSDRARGTLTGKLINIQGQVLLQEKAPADRRNWNWNTAALPEGIYFLDVSDEGGWRTVQKIWIRH